ncbi:MAG: sensor histidine kinase [Bacteroidetes bacterium]|nr:sensor histidine kinase [Bacteroidota bacterium]
MFIKIALILSIVLQFSAALMAVPLIKKTKFNISWILISIALFLMAIRRLIELIPFIQKNTTLPEVTFAHWLGIFISIFLLVGVFYIRKIFDFLKHIDELRKESEQKVLETIILTEEKERRSFAKDLHDGLGPLLSSIKMLASALSQTKQEAKNKKIVDNMNLVAGEAITSIKEISNHLSPHILDNFGLISALKSFVDKVNISKGIRIKIDSNINEERLDFNVEVVLYRVICELINNTIKHASSKNIKIDLFKESQQLNIHYTDDGKGFDINDVLIKTEGRGYANIQSRIRSINGQLIFESQPNSGVDVKIYLKLYAKN